MAPHGGMAPPKSLDIRLMPQDVFEIIPNPGGGFGDPLLRATELLETDLREGRLPREQAERYYGVVLDDRGNVDAEATAERRQALRDERLARSRAPREPVEGTAESGSAETGLLAAVALVETDAGRMQACRHCGKLLATAAGAYRRGCRELEDDMAALSEFHLDPQEQAGQHLVLRRYICPGCALALDAELCRPEDPPYIDLDACLKEKPHLSMRQNTATGLTAEPAPLSTGSGVTTNMNSQRFAVAAASASASRSTPSTSGIPRATSVNMCIGSAARPSIGPPSTPPSAAISATSRSRRNGISELP